MNKFLAVLLVFAGLTVCADEVRLSPLNTILIRGEITSESMMKAAARINVLNLQREKANYPLYVVLDSPGGDINAGLDFIRYAQTFPNVKTVTLFAASMASSIVQHLPGERLMVLQSIQMFHRAKGQFSGQFEDGEVEQRLANAKRMVRSMERVHAKRMHMSLKRYKQLVKDELWLTEGQALKMHAADRVVTVSCTQDLIDSKSVEKVSLFFFSVTLTYSNCPLLREPIQSEDSREAKLPEPKELSDFEVYY